MSEVLFLTGVADPVALALRLLRKKHREGGRAAVYGPQAVLARIDQGLWLEPPLDFVPHLRLRQDEAVPADAAQTPIWLLEAPRPELQCDSAVNLGLEQVEGLAAHAKVAEIVGVEPAEKAAGQQRWRRYKALGVAVQHRPMGAGESA
jgi:DNA polymerase III subunit chi